MALAMGGTRRENEGTPLFACNFAYAADPGSDPANSLDGMNTFEVVDRALARVRSLPGAPVYEYVESSAAVPVLNLIIAPLVGPGRWILFAGGAPGPGSACCCPLELPVRPDGSGSYPTIAAAVAFANATATPDAPIVVTLCPGTYDVAGPITVDNPDVSVVADVADESIITSANPNFTVFIVTAVASLANPTGNVFRGLRFALTAGQSAVQLAPTIAGPVAVTVENCGMIGGSAFAQLVTSSQVTIRECYALGALYFVADADPTAASRVAITDSFFVGSPAAIAVDINGINTETDIEHLFMTVPQSVNHDGICVIQRATATSATMRIRDSRFEGGINAIIALGGNVTINDTNLRHKDSTGATEATIQADACFVDVHNSSDDTLTRFLLASGAAEVEIDDCRTAAGTFIDATGAGTLVRVYDGSHNLDGVTLAAGALARWSSQDNLKAVTDMSNAAAPYYQLRERDTYAPPNSADANGDTGAINWGTDTGVDYIYVKFPGGWRRVAVAAF